MTHAQTFWKAEDIYKKDPQITPKAVKLIKTWVTTETMFPKCISDEQIILFLHSCMYNIEETKKCMEHYYALRLKISYFFQKRDIHSPNLNKTLQVVCYGVSPEKTPEEYTVAFHMLNDTNPSVFTFNDSFKIMAMMIDCIIAREGPQNGLVLLFDLKGVKLGHVTKLSLNSVKKALEYMQEAIPVRLQSIHVINTHSIVDKIMLLMRSFLKKRMLGLLHFYKENEEGLYNCIPRKCLPSDYGGDLESVHFYHERFIEEMEKFRPLFLQEEKLLFGYAWNNEESELDIASLNID